MFVKWQIPLVFCTTAFSFFKHWNNSSRWPFTLCFHTLFFLHFHSLNIIINNISMSVFPHPSSALIFPLFFYSLSSFDCDLLTHLLFIYFFFLTFVKTSPAWRYGALPPPPCVHYFCVRCSFLPHANCVCGIHSIYL